MIKEEIAKEFKEHGWVLVKGVFSKDEIEELRGKVEATRANGHLGDVLSNSLLNKLLYDVRLIDIFKNMLPGQPVYFGDGNFLLDNKDYGFHKDNPDRNDPNGPDWEGDYNIFRAGIYLQNHAKYSGGVLLRDKSFKSISTRVGKSFNVPIEPGDVAVWNLRTTHSGNAKLFKLFPGIIINPKYYGLIPKFLFKSQKKKRIGIFLTIAREGKNLDRYLQYLKSRQYAVAYWQNSVYNPEIIAKAEQNGLKILDMHEEVKNIDVKTLNYQHKDIPYQTV